MDKVVSDIDRLVTFIYDNFNVKFTNLNLRSLEEEIKIIGTNLKNIHISLIYSRKTKEVLVLSCNIPQVCVAYLTTKHAEVSALDKLMNLLINKRIEWKKIKSGVDIISLRITKDYHLRDAKPCLRCLSRLMKNKKLINKIFWSDNYENIISGNLSELKVSNFRRSKGDCRNKDYQQNLKMNN